MISSPLLQTASFPLKSLRMLALGLTIGFTSPVFADNLPDIQKLIKQGQFPQALEKADAYLSTRPKDAQGRFLKGLILTEMNKPSEAIAIFTKLTEDFPELPEPYNNLAVLYAQQKQYDKARTALEMAIRTHPSYAIAYENLGDVYAKLASQAYDKALQLDSSNTVAQNKLALIRDLISTSAKPNVKPSAAPTPPAKAPAPVVPPVVAPPVAAAPVTPPATPAAAPAPAAKQPAPSASVVSTTPGAASTANAPVANTTSSAAASAPAKAKPAAEPDGNEEINKTLGNWAAAWAKKDMKAYFAQYAPNFDPPKDMDRKAWEKEREQRIAGKPGKITVSYDDPQISVSGDSATVRFRQHYSAPGLSSSTTKTLKMVKSGNRWLIQEETSR